MKGGAPSDLAHRDVPPSIVPSWLITDARSRVFASSRTLPRRRWRINMRNAPSLNRNGRPRLPLGVGTPVTGRPRHRPGRAVFPHPVPRSYSHRARQDFQTDTYRFVLAIILGGRNSPRLTARQNTSQVKLLRFPPRRFSHLKAQAMTQRKKRLIEPPFPTMP